MAPPTARQITGGNFQDPSGSPLNAGYVTFQLTTDGLISGNQISAGVIVKATLDSNGSISGLFYLWPNNLMSPSTTKYIVKAFSNSGELSFESENVVPSGAGSFDIGTWIPSY